MINTTVLRLESGGVHHCIRLSDEWRCRVVKKLLMCAVAGLLVLFLLRSGQAAEDKTFTATTGADGVQRVEVVGTSYSFQPNHIIVKANVPVELAVSKEGGLTPHDIEMKSPEAGMEFSTGLSTTPKTITFTPTKPGSYPFYCSKKAPFSKSHRERGMEGVIEVVP
jgi:plastocyanin